MRRPLLLSLVSLLAWGTALPAPAATIDLSANTLFPTWGETVFITVTLSIDEGETAPGALVTLGYAGAPTNATLVNGVDQLTSFGGSAPWTTAALEGQCDQRNLCRVIDQIAPNPTGAGVQPSYTSSAVFSFLIEGIDSFFDIAVNNFFGAANPPALHLITVPEPGTLGLISFAALLAGAGARLRRSTFRGAKTG
ncbi:MAG: PEP-CTERM sorting domain-containing protein [Myxococcota bacterium]